MPEIASGHIAQRTHREQLRVNLELDRRVGGSHALCYSGKNPESQNVIRALPAILAEPADVVYIVAGATHPHIKRREGDVYRLQLQALARGCGVSSNVIFNRFVGPEELIETVGVRDIYITLYRRKLKSFPELY